MAHLLTGNGFFLVNLSALGVLVVDLFCDMG